ncbi:MAG: insulinase family protein [Actinomycetaceae bacterium]|nr:insulinase family protein [Actinomycetaceae bacterium]
MQRSILPGGIRVITETVPSYRSVSLGMWIGTGSRDEVEGTFGSTHFLEHLLFKGTAGRSSVEIAERTDYLGGSFNAATSKQYTYYYGHVFEEDLDNSIELLMDMVIRASLDEKDMEMERGVILEELAMYNDDASEVASEKMPPLVFGDHPLSRPVGGTKESVQALEHASLVEHYRKRYTPQELVVAAAGAVDHEKLCERVLYYAHLFGWNVEDGVAAKRSDIGHPLRAQDGSAQFYERHVEQASVLLSMPGVSLDDGRRSALFSLSMILGGGTSSRLFQKIREERGLAYTTYAYPISYREGGMFSLYGACSPENAGEVATLMSQTLREIATEGISADEHESAFRRIRADLVFEGERISSRMSRLGTADTVRGRYVTRNQLIEQARNVTSDNIVEMAKFLIEQPRSLVIVGPDAARKYIDAEI